MEKKRVELLAPAGSFDSMKAAVAAGADAVYMGGARFGARAYAENADEKGLLEAIDYVHLHGCRLYMTVNTLFKEEELRELYDFLLPYYKRGLDGVIVQDLGALRFMREHFPGMELHASTQMTITSPYGAKMMKELGCCRVVPARELSLEEISRIHREAGVEVECFIHGALCYCYSGQCLMSSLIGGRSGNRGRCAQPCRLPYTVFEKGERKAEERKAEERKTAEWKNAGQKTAEWKTAGRREAGRKDGGRKAKLGRDGALNGENQRFVLSLKDLCTLDILPEIIEAGVYSLKIEGRMKSPRYTAGVVSIYRKYVDRYLEYGKEGYYVEPEDRKLLLDLFDRGGFTEGYYKQHNGRDMAVLKEKPDFREGNQRLFDYLDSTYVQAELKEPVKGRAIFREKEPALLELWMGDVKAEVKGQIPQRAQNQPMTEEKAVKQLNKTGGTPFYFEELRAEIGDGLFMPIQALNELRRDGLDALKRACLAPWVREESFRTGKESFCIGGESGGIGTGNRAAAALLTAERLKISVSLEEESQLPPVLECQEAGRIYLDAAGFGPESWRETAERCHSAGKECWLMLPHIFREQARQLFDRNRRMLEEAGFDGLLARTLEEVQWMREERIQLPTGLDASVYAWNSASVKALTELSVSFLTMPWELNARELRAVARACAEAGTAGEMIVYGYAPMMVSAQCITRTVSGCTHDPRTLYMKDRTGAMLPVKNRCRFCYNTIYNPLPLSLLGSREEMQMLGIGGVRLAFTVEEKEEVQQVLAAFSASFARGEEARTPFESFTRGHFRRGVE
ncbi:MAG: DUF3656 domain-containing protein [Enterocloster sp.]